MLDETRRERIYEPRPRLIAARSRKYPTPEEAAQALGIPAPTYRGHENGSRGLSRNAERYARFFGVSLEWLLTGRGSMGGAPTIQVAGRIGAGAIVEQGDDDAEIAAGADVELPAPNATDAFVVQGDSMLPRFLPGEVLLFERDAAPSPAVLVGQYCRVQTLADGRTYVKILWPGRHGSWTLSSHTGALMQDVELLAAWRWVGLLPARDGRHAPIPAVKVSRVAAGKK